MGVKSDRAESFKFSQRAKISSDSSLRSCLTPSSVGYKKKVGLNSAANTAHLRGEKYKFTEALRHEFCRLYAKGYTVGEAAREVGTTSTTVFTWNRKDPEFAKRFAKARELCLDVLEDQLHLMGRSGNVTAIFGMLRAFRSIRWREGVQVQHDVSDNFAAMFSMAMAAVTSGVPNGAPASNTETGLSSPVH